MLCRGWRWALVLALVLAVARSSAADPAGDDAARLAGLLGTGAKAAKAKDWPTCVNAFAQALAIDGAPTTAGNLGLCEEKAGKLVAAYDHLRRALDAAPSSQKDEVSKGYQAALSRIVGRVGLVWITVYPREARVLLDGRPIGRADGRAFAVEPGEHTIAARHDGYFDAVRPLSVRGGDVPHVDLRLAAKAAPPPRTSAPVESRATPSSAVRPADASGPARTSWPCLPAWSARGVLVPAACVGAAVFVASAATAIGFEVHASSLRRALNARGFTESTCTAGPAVGSPDCKEVAARVTQRDDTTNVLIGSGVVAGVLAVSAGLAIALEPLGPKAQGPKITAMATASGGGIGIYGTW